MFNELKINTPDYNVKELFATFIAKNFGISGKEFIEVMKTANCYISGSIIIDIINKTNHCNDMDIFYNVDNRISGLPESVNINLLEVYIMSQGYNKIIAENVYPGSSTIITYHKSGCDKTIQFIVMGSTKNIESKVKHFDIDICKNYFDGDKCWCYKYNSMNIQDKQFRAFIDDIVQYREKTIARIEKYIKRGFSFKGYTMKNPTVGLVAKLNALKDD